jgi:hypothetical protein
VTIEEFIAAEHRTDAAVASLDEARMDRDDADLIRDEIRNAAAMLKYATHRGRSQRGDERIDCDLLANERKAIAAEHQRLWLVRNRPGGLRDSLTRLDG